MRLIDADALLSKCKDIVLKYPDGTEYRHRCVDPGIIREMPTIDPVKHGRWIEDKYMSDVDSCIYTRYICSSCGAIEYKKYSYCHCGARMDVPDNDVGETEGEEDE